MSKGRIDDRDWIKANPTRRYRIRRRGKPDARKLAPVSIMKINEDRRSWSKRNILMRDELPDSDVGAELALQEYEIITKAQLDRINKRIAVTPGSTVIDTVLAMLRQQKPYE